MFWLHIIGVGSWNNEHFNNIYESAGDNNSKEGNIEGEREPGGRERVGEGERDRDRDGERE